MNPDYLIDGEIFDNYAPKTNNVRNIRGYVFDKVRRNQAKNIVINLRDTEAKKEEIKQILIEYPIEGLGRLWIVDKHGKLHYVFGGKRWE